MRLSVDTTTFPQIVHELIERFDAHLKADKFYSVIANMRGESPEQVATLLMKAEGLRGLQGPTISSVYNMEASGTAAQHGFYAATICVSKKNLYKAVKSLQKVRSLPDDVQQPCLIRIRVNLLSLCLLRIHSLEAAECWCNQ